MEINLSKSETCRSDEKCLYLRNKKNVHIDRVRTHLNIIGMNHPGPHCGKVLITLAGGFHTSRKRNACVSYYVCFCFGKCL